MPEEEQGCQKKNRGGGGGVVNIIWVKFVSYQSISNKLYCQLYNPLSRVIQVIIMYV